MGDIEHAAWLQQRRTCIGASESPALFGHGYVDQSPYSIWAEKRGLVQVAPEDQERLQVGKIMEPAIRELFRARTGMHVQPHNQETLLRSQVMPFISCTPDAYVEDGNELGLLEIKHVNGFHLSRWEDEVPLQFQIQVQHQMAVTGLAFAYVAALIGGFDLRWQLVPRHDAFIETALLPKLKEFWALVESGTPPEIDASAATEQTLKLLHPNDDGSEVELPAEATKWDAELQGLKTRAAQNRLAIDLLENRIKAAIGDATYGVLPDGSRYSWKTCARKAYSVEAGTYRQLRRLKK